jgi:hypothetical protein
MAWSLKIFRAELSSERLTRFEDEFRRRTSISCLEAIAVVLRRGFSPSDEVVPALQTVFVGLLEKGVSDEEIVAILIDVELILKFRGVEKAREDESLYAALFSVGQQPVCGEIHTLLFGILGYIGLREAPEQFRGLKPHEIEFSFDAKTQRINMAELTLETCTALLFPLLDSESSSVQRVSIFVALIRVFEAAFTDLCLATSECFDRFLYLFWSGLAAMPADDQAIRILLSELCCLPAISLSSQVDSFVDEIIRSGDIALLPLLADKMGIGLDRHLTRLIDFVIDSEFTSDSVRALKSLVLDVNADDELASRVISYLLDWSDAPGVLQAIASIVHRTRCNIDSVAGRLARFCIRRPDDRDCIVILRRLASSPVLGELVRSMNIDVELAPEDDDSSDTPPSKERTSLSTPILTAILDDCKSVGGVSGSFGEFRRLCLGRCPNRMIVACASVSNQYPTVAHGLLNLAVYWIRLSDKGGPPSTGLFQEWLTARDDQGVVVATIELIEFMDRVRLPLVDLSELTSVAISSLPSVSLQLWDALVSYPVPEWPPDRHWSSAWWQSEICQQRAAAYRNAGRVAEARDLSPDDSAASVPSFYDQLGLGERESEAKLFEALGKRFGPRFAQGFTAVLPSLAFAQQVIETGETASENCLTRLAKCSSLFHAAVRVLEYRIQLHPDSSNDEKLLLLQLAAESHEWESFERFRDAFQGVQHDAALANYYWERRCHEEALPLIEELSTHGDHSIWALYVRCAIRMEEHREVLVAPTCKHSDCWVAWAWANLSHSKYSEAMKAFALVIRDSSNWRLSDILQVIRLAFDRGLKVSVADAKTALEIIPLPYFIGVVNHLLAKQDRVEGAGAEEGKFEVYEELMVRLMNAHPSGVVFAIQCSIESDGVAGEVPLIGRIVEAHAASASSDPGGTFSAASSGAMAILNLLRGLTISCKGFLYRAACTFRRALDKYRVAPYGLQRENAMRWFKSTESWVEKGLAQFQEKDISPLAREFNSIKRLNSQLFTGDLRTTSNEVAGLIKTLAPPRQTTRPQLEDRSLSDFFPRGFDSRPDTFRKVPIFGKYRPESDSHICIDGLPSEVRVLTSKQRPCRLKLKGTDGVFYTFLVKGNEDLRRDERLMQFFTLLNSILQSKIRTYSITPIDAYVGILQWIPDAPVLRELVGIGYPHEGELALPTLTFAPDGRLEEQVAAFREEQANWENVIRDALWIIARNSERWLLYQTNFPKSLAVMSMVGYLIGLGDRHLENLLFEKRTGIVAHIDFGYCFDEARKRTNCPEGVAFRATRSLAVACGPLGFDGAFRRECERTFGTLRQNEESVQSVLNLFVDQPVQSPANDPHWRPPEAQVADHRAARTQLDQALNKLRDERTTADLVAALITEATDPKNLLRLYSGWRAWV